MATSSEKHPSLSHKFPVTQSLKEFRFQDHTLSDVSLQTKNHNPFVHSLLHLTNCLHRFTFDVLSPTLQLTIIMLAIPVLLLASAILSGAHPFDFVPNLVRSAFPAPNPEPIAAPEVVPQLPHNQLSSVLGPLTQQNFPDPAIFVHNGLTYAFATNNRGRSEYGMIHIQVATSTDNKTWTMKEGWDALPTVGEWQTGHRVWAPDVVQVVSFP